VGVSFSTHTESTSMLLPTIGIAFASLALLKLGALAVMVNVLSGIVTVLLLVILGLAALLGWKHFKKQ
jgi:hypothetical protein